MKYLFTFILLTCSTLMMAQPTNGQVAYYSMDDCTLIDNSGNGSNGVWLDSINVLCNNCGVEGQANALRIDANSHGHGLLLGPVNNEFRQNSFSISFYMKPTDNLGIKDIMSKRQACNDENAFAIRFIPATNSISVELSENANKKAPVSAPLDFGTCWQHIVFVRQGANSLLYINGVLKDEQSTPDGTPVNLDNVAVFSISDSPCNDVDVVPYQGALDELYIYKRALNESEVQELYLAPDKIVNENTTIFLGESVQLDATASCADTYEWSPTTFLTATDIPNPVSTPDTTITYTLSFTEDLVCIAFDTVTITVIDPSGLDCGEIYLPKAFTPNDDNLNDTYGISNPYAVDNLLSFEIFDRWGSRIFFTDNPFEQWDGSYKGKPLNPGVLLYRIRFTCDGTEQIDVGSLAIIR